MPVELQASSGAAPQRHRSTEKTKRRGCFQVDVRARERALAKQDSQGRNSLKVQACFKSQAHLRAGRELNSLRVDERFRRKGARREKMKKGEAGRDSAVLHGS